MSVKKGLYYSENHEWISVEGDIAYIGITDFAQHSLGEIVFVELPEEEDRFDKDDTLCVVESVKAASDVYAPVSIEVLEVNEKLEDEPQLVNATPYDAYFCKVRLVDKNELDGLMNSEAYESFIEED